MTNPSHNFWDFSLRVYQLPNIEQSCLHLQDVHGLDVNLLLFCFWHGHANNYLQEKGLTEAVEYSTNWQLKIVQPLRHARQELKNQRFSNEQLKDDRDRLRTQVKALELLAEKRQQLYLENTELIEYQVSSEANTRSATAQNLERYLRTAGVVATADILEAVSTIETACSTLNS